MRKVILLAAVIGLSSAAVGCTHVVSALGPNTVMSNGAWFTETTGLGPYLPFSTAVYYCPPMGAGGASTCMEAEMIEGAPPAAPAGAAEMAPPPAAPPAEGEGEAGMEGGYEGGEM